MVKAVRSGLSLRAVAARFGVSPATVHRWVARAKGRRLNRVDFEGRTPGRAANCTPPEIEERILALRVSLREISVLGEFGAGAIRAVLEAEAPGRTPPSRATIHRVLTRHGVLDASKRHRRPAPPKGWHLPEVAAGKAELDTFDFIEGLKLERGPLLEVLTATSLHGSLSDAWMMTRATAKDTLEAILSRWRREGLPDYAQFDNATLFQGAHQFKDSVGRVIRACLALGVTPVFAPPREPGFQNAIEGFNGLWQAKVWRRFHFKDLPALEAASARYVAAHRAKTAPRRDRAPARRPFPVGFRLDLHAPLAGTLVFIRRTDDRGQVHLLGRTFPICPQWTHRLVRCEVSFDHQRIRFHALRRRDPAAQPLLRETAYERPDRPFQGHP